MLLASCGKSDPIPMFVGTYTDQGSDGIYSFSFDQESGKAKAQHSAKISNPSYLVIAPNDSFHVLRERKQGRRSHYKCLQGWHDKRQNGFDKQGACSRRRPVPPYYVRPKPLRCQLLFGKHRSCWN